MWKRKILKKKARLSMRQNYWRMIAVCFIITMLTTAYPTTTTFLSAQTSSLSPGPQSSISFTPNETNSEVLRETISNIAQVVGASKSSEELTAAGMNILVDLYSLLFSAAHCQHISDRTLGSFHSLSLCRSDRFVFISAVRKPHPADR